MADKTIGDLTQAESIGNEDLFVLEQSNEAKKLKGAQLVKYAQDAVGAQVTSATQAAENAAAAKTGAESAQTEAQAARDAILNMIVEAITLESGAAATVDKSLVDSVYKLTFGLPSGKKGDPGATGPVNKLTIGTVTSGTEASATITGEAPNQVLNLVLKQGEKGDSGVYVGAGDMPEGYNVQIDPSGTGGEIVTAETIESALGYTPADSADVADKLTAPSTAAVGQIFRVASINEDGSLTLEAVDMPSGESDKPFELIDTITLDENVAQIVRNTEPDGTPYNFCKMMVMVKIPASTVFTAGFASELIADTFYFYGPFSETTQYICQVILLLEIRNGRVFGNMAESVGSAHTASSYRGTVNLSGNLIKDAIDVFRMKTYTSSGIPSGVEVSIYGVRK